uniref:Peroxin-7 n=1 Tax=Entomoneis paludosa TaxID=265537 RepID=A0A7S2YFY4_9STRA
MSSQPYLVSACYDGSLHVLQPDSNSSNNGAWKPVASSIAAHQGPIKCLSLAYHPSQQSLWMATGAMDNTVSLHEYNNTTTPLTCRATAVHAASVASVSLWPQPIRNGNDGPTLCLASGDWDGGVFLWSHDLNHDSHSPTNDDDQEEVTSHKKRKTGSQTAIDAESTAIQKLSPTVSLQAHNSKVSGVCWGNYEKRLALESSSSTMPEQLITASWDHSIKVWNIERQDCLLTLNSSRVVSCLDTSPHSAGICVTGHPDCTVRLWDVRAATTAVDESMTVSDNVFRPSHQAWISDVQWSSTNPYQVYSSSHDGTVKVWDIRSSLPLYTVRVLPASTGEKVLSLATWETSNNDTTTTNRGYLFAGGTNRVVEQFELKSLKPLS